jgi:hypothetical protein
MHNSDVSTSISLRVSRRRLSDDTRRQLLARFHRSDLTQRAFCEQAGIPLIWNDLSSTRIDVTTMTRSIGGGRGANRDG